VRYASRLSVDEAEDVVLDKVAASVGDELRGSAKLSKPNEDEEVDDLPSSGACPLLRD
jgi:hypothetical protein